MHYYGLVILASWLVFLVYWFVSSWSAKRNAVRNPRGILVRILLALLALAFLHFSGARGLEPYAGPYSEVLGWGGALLAALGIAYAVWARRTLGRNWGMPMSVKEAPELVTSGPYARVRHPIYTGVLLAIFGSLITVGFAWLLIFVVAAAYFTYSATQEEKLLAQTFPDAYPAYKARTRMLVPFIF